MTVIVQSSNEGIISLPASLMRSLNLHEGEKIKTIIEGKTLRLTSLEQFLALRGTLSENSEFDAAINFLNQEWQSWKNPPSV